MNFYVGTLAQGVTEDDLMGIFKEYGEVASVKMIKDRFTGQSKGYAFLEMPDNSDADKAIKALNGKPLKGKSIKITQVEAGKKGKKRRRF